MAQAIGQPIWQDGNGNRFYTSVLAEDEELAIAWVKGSLFSRANVNLVEPMAIKREGSDKPSWL